MVFLSFGTCNGSRAGSLGAALSTISAAGIGGSFTLERPALLLDDGGVLPLFRLARKVPRQTGVDLRGGARTALELSCVNTCLVPPSGFGTFRLKGAFEG